MKKRINNGDTLSVKIQQTKAVRFVCETGA